VRVVWSPTALNEIAHIHAYFADFNPRAAAILAEAPADAGDSLAIFPHRGRRVPGTDLREWVILHPYSLRYRIDKDTVRILRVCHGAQR
jgi:plasmid stabilization system protein ParE